ncbi:MAG TPA: YcdB/YcdC domain-containing protein, partial [Oscillospiraceae bacterium]|nr:YcdB/YcdC domain-containing protein [Oscillospiraceae bacterium]
MIKRIVTFIVTLILFLVAIIPLGYGQEGFSGYAQENFSGHEQAKSSILTKTEAEKLSRQKLNIAKDYKFQYNNLHTRDIQQKQFWNLEFEGENKYISVTLAADSGDIISMNQWGNEDCGNAVILLRDEAKQIAVDFIKSLENKKFKETEEITVKAPTIIPYYLYGEEQSTDNYHFMFVRKLGDEFFPGNYFTVNVSGINGKITNYEMKWEEADYKQGKQLLTEQKARVLFEKEDRLHLKYAALNKYNSEDSRNVILTPVYTYVPKESDKIDAVTGKLLPYDELYDWNYINGGYGAADDGARKEMMSMVVPGSGTEMIPEEGVISKEKAEQIVMNILKGNVDLDSIRLNNTNYTNYYAGVKGRFWTLYWSSAKGDKYISAAVNAENNEILEVSYNKGEYVPIINTKDPVSAEEIKGAAADGVKFVEEKIQKMFPGIREQLQLEVEQKEIQEENRANISSFRYIDEIPFENNYVRMDIDTDTKEIINLDYMWQEVDVQKPESILN